MVNFYSIDWPLSTVWNHLDTWKWLVGHFLALLDMQQLVFADQVPEQEEKKKKKKKNFAWCQIPI